MNSVAATPLSTTSSFKEKSQAATLEPITLDFKNDYIASGVTVLPGKLNEDKYSIYNSDEYIAFAVFDGHGGTFGSQLCADKFLSNVVAENNKKLKLLKKLSNSPTQHDIADTLMCEAIRKITKAISREIKLRSITGTTSVSLFLKKFPDGSVRAYCGNTGDSRCIVYRRPESRGGFKVMIMSEDHNLTLERETDRISQRKTVEWKPLPASEHKEVDTRTGWKMQSTYPSHMRMARAITFLKLLKAASYSDKVDLAENERDTEKRRPSVLFDPAVFESLLEQMKAVEVDDVSMSAQYDLPTPEECANRTSVELSMAELLEVTVHGIQQEYSKQMEQHLIEIDSDNENEVDDSQFITAPIIHNDSFIGRRTTKDGKYVGKKALFSRHDISITMTRSIGDRHAARSCVCTPEVTAITIKPNEYARFILASDGFWDVVDSDSAAKLICNITDQTKATELLVMTARKARDASRMRIDDITAIVVDVNPQAKNLNASKFLMMSSATNANCGCTIA